MVHLVFDTLAFKSDIQFVFCLHVCGMQPGA